MTNISGTTLELNGRRLDRDQVEGLMTSPRIDRLSSSFEAVPRTSVFDDREAAAAERFPRGSISDGHDNAFLSPTSVTNSVSFKFEERPPSRRRENKKLFDQDIVKMRIQGQNFSTVSSQSSHLIHGTPRHYPIGHKDKELPCKVVKLPSTQSANERRTPWKY